MKKRKITKITLAALLAAAVVSGGCSQSSVNAEVNRKTRAAVKQKMKAAANVILKTKLQMQQILFQIQKN